MGRPVGRKQRLSDTQRIFGWLYTAPPDDKTKLRRNDLLWHYYTKLKLNGPHETGNYKSKRITARNKAKSYAVALTTFEANFDNESVASVDMWGSEIDEPPKKKKGTRVRPQIKTQRGVKWTTPQHTTLTSI